MNHIWLDTGYNDINQLLWGLIKPRPRRRSLMARDQTIGLGVKPLRVAHHSDRDIRVGDGRRPACAIDHVQDTSEPGRGEKDREQIVEA